MGLLADILKGISKPGRDLAELSRLVSSVRQADPEINRNVRSLDERTQAIRDLQEYEPFFQTQTEQLGTFLKPVDTTLRNAATVGSLVAPVGVAGNIASRAGAGALGAGLSSYGMTPIEEDVDPMRVLGSTLFGAGIGAAVGGVEKGLMNKAQGQKGFITKQGENLEKSSTGITKPKSPFAESLSDEAFQDFKSITGKYGAGTDIKGMDKAARKASEVINRSIKAGTSTASTDDIVLSAASKIADELGVSDDVALRLAQSTAKRAGVGGVLDSQGLANLKKFTQPNALKIQKAMDTGMSLPRTRYADYAINSVADDILKAGLDETGRMAYQDLAKLYKIAPDVVKKADKAGHITIANIKLPTANLPQKAQNLAGKTVQRVGNIGTNINPDIVSLLGSGTIYGTRLAQALGQEEPMQQGQIQTPQVQQAQPQYQEDLPGGVTNEEFDALKYYLADSVFQGDITMDEANGILQLLGVGDMGGEEAAGPTTEGQRDYLMAAEALQNAYQLVDQGAGKLPTIGGNIAGFFGETTGSSEYKSSLDTATAFLRKALIGTGQSEAELKNLNLPKPTDEPAIAKQKIEALIPLLRARAGVQNY
jgi:hypothetical protein